EKSRTTIHAHVSFVLRHSFPLLAVSTKIYILRTPLLALPTIIQLTIGRQVNQSFIDDLQYIVDWRSLKLLQCSAFKWSVNGHKISSALSYQFYPPRCVARHLQTQFRLAFCNSLTIHDNTL